jgi:hypothetical protein
LNPDKRHCQCWLNIAQFWRVKIAHRDAIVTRDNGEVYEVPLAAIEFSCMRCSTTSTALRSPAFVRAGGAHLHGLARGRLPNPSKTLCGPGQSEISATLL